MHEATRGQQGRDVAPCFALVDLAATDVGRRLRSRDWHPIAAANDLESMDPSGIATAEVLVVCCTERQFLTPSTQAASERVAAALPRLAVVTGLCTDVVAYAARLGWHGIVPAATSTAALARAIATVSSGGLSFPSSSVQALVEALALVAPMNESPVSALTPRQQQIVALIAQGSTDAEIAVLLRISRSTAHKHVQNARRRLGAKTRSQLVATSRDLAQTEDRAARARAGLAS